MTWELYVLGYFAIGAVIGLMGDIGNRFLEGKNMPTGRFILVAALWPAIILLGLFVKIEKPLR